MHNFTIVKKVKQYKSFWFILTKLLELKNHAHFNFLQVAIVDLICIDLCIDLCDTKPCPSWLIVFPSLATSWFSLFVSKVDALVGSLVEPCLTRSLTLVTTLFLTRSNNRVLTRSMLETSFNENWWKFTLLVYLLDRNNCHITLLYVSLVLWGTLVKTWKLSTLWFIGWFLTGLCLYMCTIDWNIDHRRWSKRCPP